MLFKPHALMPMEKWVKESRFGIWFLNTPTWKHRVLNTAILDLKRALPDGYQASRILDIGCGRGNSFSLLEQYFRPEQIVAIEIDHTLLPDALASARQCHCQVEVTLGNAEQLPFADQRFDMVFCHQSFHHIVQHRVAMHEFHRVLNSDGRLLFAESCKRFIHSPAIRLLFRHPMAVQKNAAEYLELIRECGFHVPEQAVSTPDWWWSRPDIGALEWFGLASSQPSEPTLLNLVASKS